MKINVCGNKKNKKKFLISKTNKCQNKIKINTQKKKEQKHPKEKTLLINNNCIYNLFTNKHFKSKSINNAN